jgi:hypothetical protein
MTPTPNNSSDYNPSDPDRPSFSSGLDPRSAHPDMRADAPGRIPESLIDAAIDGELCDEMQREIAHALRYDPLRKQELLETTDAINALQMPISTPDFSDHVLERANQHRRFIPATWRKHVRTGRLSIAAVLLLSLMSVAGLQRLYPRLTTLAAHPTPVSNVETAFEDDACRLAEQVHQEFNVVRASVPALADMVKLPGDSNFSFGLSAQRSSTDSIARTTPTEHVAHAFVVDSRLPQSDRDQIAIYINGKGSFILSQPNAARFVGAAPWNKNTQSWVYATSSKNSRTSRRIYSEMDSTELDVFKAVSDLP